MPTRHQFTNLPLFIDFSFLGLTRAVQYDLPSNILDRVGDVDGGQFATKEGFIANVCYRVGDID